METESTITTASGDGNSEDALMKKLEEVNKVSSPLPEFMQTPKGKNTLNQDKTTFKRSSLIQHSQQPLVIALPSLELSMGQ